MKSPLFKTLALAVLIIPAATHAFAEGKKGAAADADTKTPPKAAVTTGDVKADLKTEVTGDAKDEAAQVATALEGKIDDEISEFTKLIGKEFEDRKCAHVQTMVKNYLNMPIRFDANDTNGVLADRQAALPLATKIAKAVAPDPKTFSKWLSCASSVFMTPGFQDKDDIVRHETQLSRALRTAVGKERAVLEFHKTCWQAGAAIVGFGGGAGGRVITIAWDDIVGAFVNTRFGAYVADLTGFITKEESTIADKVVSDVTKIAGARAGAVAEQEAQAVSTRLQAKLGSLTASGAVTGLVVYGTTYLFPEVTGGDIQAYVNTSNTFLDGLTNQAEEKPAPKK